MICRPALLFLFLNLILILLLHTPFATSTSTSQAFIAWAHSVGLDSSNISLQSPTILAGWGIRAARPIQKGDIFMTIPESAIWDPKRAVSELRSLHAQLADVLQTRFSPVEALTLYFMMRLAEFDGANEDVGAGIAASAPGFSTWLQMLPSNYHGVIMWSDKQLGHIRDARALARIRAISKEFADMSAKMQVLLAGAPASARSSMKLLQLPREDQHHLFNVATCIIQSRSFGDFRLVPVLDMFNFSPHTNLAPTWRENVDGFTGYVLAADRDYDADEEIHLFYGPKGNHNLLEMYGFALLDNPFNCAMLYPKFFDKHQDSKHRIARMLGTDMDYGICVNADTLSPSLYTVSALALLDVESMPRSDFLRAASSPHSRPLFMVKVVNNLLDGLKAAVASQEDTVKEFMHLSLIRRELSRWNTKSTQFATMYRRSVAITLNLANENCLHGAIRALSEQLQQLQAAAP